MLVKKAKGHLTLELITYKYNNFFHEFDWNNLKIVPIKVLCLGAQGSQAQGLDLITAPKSGLGVDAAPTGWFLS